MNKKLNKEILTRTNHKSSTTADEMYLNPAIDDVFVGSIVFLVVVVYC